MWGPFSDARHSRMYHNHQQPSFRIHGEDNLCPETSIIDSLFRFFPRCNFRMRFAKSRRTWWGITIGKCNTSRIVWKLALLDGCLQPYQTVMRYWSMQRDGSTPYSLTSADTLMYVRPRNMVHMSWKFNEQFQQLVAMTSVILFQCRPDEAEVQRWYIERKQYDFVIYNKTNSDVIQLTRENDMWSRMRSGTRITIRVIIEEVIHSTVTATYNCPCGTPNIVDVSVEDLASALQRGCTITW